MSTTRLAFLYPHLFRSIKAVEPAAHAIHIRHRAGTSQAQCCQARRLATSIKREQRHHQKRHGKAVEPMNHQEEKEKKDEGLKVFAPEEEGKDEEKSKEFKKRIEEAEAKELREPEPSEPLSKETQAAAELPGDNGEYPLAKSKIGGGELTPLQQAAANTADPSAPLETVLQMPAPESLTEEDIQKPPHLETPPYVHHFDTYTLVQQVEAGGFTAEQSITAMKAVRGLLAVNLDVAKAGLVSKSDVENETYLFRAACSELKTEIQNSRRKNEETMRRERTLLQHEVDILNQKLSQDLLTLKDELKGMFDDRKMSVRGEQRVMESKIQELNYKITVSLNSDSKSEVEGLRWVLTRRSVMGILFMAFMVLTSLRYASFKSHEAELEKRREAGMKHEESVHIEELPAQGAAEILAAN